MYVTVNRPPIDGQSISIDSQKSINMLPANNVLISFDAISSWTLVTLAVIGWLVCRKIVD